MRADLKYARYGLNKKTVVITGATSGAGRAAAIEFAKHKANLVLAARNINALRQVEAECKSFGTAVITVKTDMGSAEAATNLALAAYTFTGTIDVWINNAGVLAAGAFTETPVDVHSQVIKTNLIGYINGAHAVLPYFKRQRKGILINNISVGAWLPVPYGTAYSASKFGLLGFTEALRAEYIKWKHIYICDLFPAFLDTPGIQHAANYTGKTLRPAPPVYDPQRVARKMVAIAVHPRTNVTVGSVAYLLKLSHLLMPGITRFFTAKLMEAYFRNAESIPATNGNVFETVEYGTSIYGGWNTVPDAKRRSKTVAAMMILTGAIAGFAWFIKDRKKL